MGDRWCDACRPGAEEFDELRKNVEKQKAAQEEQAKKQGNENQQLPEVKVPDLKVTAKAPAKAADSIAANKQRTEQLKVLKDDRQSKDAAKQLAASTLMVCSSAPDPLQGSDDPALPLVACDASTNQPYILGEVPLLVGQTDPVHGKRLTGNEIDSNRPITGGLNSQTGQMEISFAFKAGDNEKGSETLSGTDLKIKLDLDSFPEITHFSQINQVRIVPYTKNDKDKTLSDLLEEYYSGSSNKATPLFTIEIVYTVPVSEKRSNNKSLQLLYRTSIIHKINKKTNKIATIETEELVEARYTCEFLQSVAGIDQNLDHLAVGVVSPDGTTAFNYDIKYLKKC